MIERVRCVGVAALLCLVAVLLYSRQQGATKLRYLAFSAPPSVTHLDCSWLSIIAATSPPFTLAARCLVSLLGPCPQPTSCATFHPGIRTPLTPRATVLPRTPCAAHVSRALLMLLPLYALASRLIRLLLQLPAARSFNRASPGPCNHTLDRRPPVTRSRVLFADLGPRTSAVGSHPSVKHADGTCPSCTSPRHSFAARETRAQRQRTGALARCHADQPTSCHAAVQQVTGVSVLSMSAPAPRALHLLPAFAR
jgi:hypothetical protein